MIARTKRFHGRRQVARVRGRSLHAPHLSLRAVPRRHNSYRLAVVASKKVAPRAVVRNRIRRRVFEAVRTEGLFDKSQLDVVVYVKDPVVAVLPWADVVTELQSLAKKAKHPQNGSQHAIVNTKRNH